jgi:hypothetical protein
MKKYDQDAQPTMSSMVSAWTAAANVASCGGWEWPMRRYLSRASVNVPLNGASNLKFERSRGKGAFSHQSALLNAFVPLHQSKAASREMGQRQSKRQIIFGAFVPSLKKPIGRPIHEISQGTRKRNRLYDILPEGQMN